MSYARVQSRIADSEDWAALPGAKSPAGVYVMTWAACDPYGVIPGSPLAFAGRVCPLLGFTPRGIEKILLALEAAGHLIRYEANGHQYNYFPCWHKHQYVQWDRIGAPQYPLPDCWEMPDDLKAFLAAGKGSRPMRAYFSQEPPAPLGRRPDSSKILSECSQSTIGELHSHTQDSVSVSVSEKTSPKSPPALPAGLKKPTPVQKVLEEAWAHCGLEGKPGGKGYSNASGAVAKHGIPLLREWMGATMFDPPALPEGGNSSLWFGETIRAALAQPFNWRDKGSVHRLPTTQAQLDRDLLDPSGTAFGPEIDRYHAEWVAWADAARNGTRPVRAKTWGEAIREALKKPPDLSKLAAGPPEGAK